MSEAAVSPFRRTVRLMRHLAWWDLVAQYFGSWFGLLWNLALPALVIVVYLAVFELSPKFQFGGWNAAGGYGVNLVAALLPWLVFQESVSRAANSYVDQRHLLTQLPIPPALFPIANVLSALVRHAVALTLLGTILMFSGIRTGVYWFGLLGVLPIVVLMSVGFSILAAALTVVNRDVGPGVSAAMLPLFFATPVVYPAHIVPASLQVVMDLNPLTPLVLAYRDLLVTGQWPLLGGLLWSAAVGVVVLAIAAVVLRRLGPELPERL